MLWQCSDWDPKVASNAGGYQQELSYRKQIARKLRIQFVDGISVTLKSTLRVTQGHSKQNIGQIKHDLLLDELLDVENYRDLEMWVRDHSRSLKLVSFESLGARLLFAFYSNCGRICSRL